MADNSFTKEANDINLKLQESILAEQIERYNVVGILCCEMKNNLLDVPQKLEAGNQIQSSRMCTELSKKVGDGLVRKKLQIELYGITQQRNLLLVTKFLDDPDKLTRRYNSSLEGSEANPSEKP